MTWFYDDYSKRILDKTNEAKFLEGIFRKAELHF